MARVNFSVDFNGDQLKAKLKRASRYYVERSAEAGGREMVRAAKSKIAREFNVNSLEEERRHPGSPEASEALGYEVIEVAPAEFKIQFTIEQSDDVVARIIFMNYGTRPHDIYPNGQFLVWPGGDGGRDARARVVHHPGQQGRHFLEESAQEVIQSIRSTGNPVRNRG